MATCEEPGIESADSLQPAPPALAADSLAQSVLILLVLTVLQRLVGLVRGLIFCRWLTPEELGEWEMCFSFLLFAAPLAILSLPGSFGRYMEQFRVRGLFHVLLKRTALATLGMATFAATVLMLFSVDFSSWIFGRSDCTELIVLLTAALLAVISFNYMIDVFTGLRMQRVVSQLQTIQALSFAIIGLALLTWYRQGAPSVVIAYGGGSLIAFAVALPQIRKVWRTAPRSPESISHASFWGKLLPYAASLWAANWLSNAFLLADRYLIIHFSGMSADEALSQVGQYHTARLVPVLVLTFAGLLSSILLPHLSYDWETGCRKLACDRMNLFLKGLSLALLGSMAVLLLAAPTLFELVFGGKFELALAVLPWTIGYCVWASLGYVVRTYLWCDEKVMLSSTAYAIGLAVSIGLNLLLLPSYGLYGAVWGTAGGNLVALLLMVAFSMYRGMEMQRGSWLALAMPLAICLGAWPATAATLVSLLLIWRTDWMLNEREKKQVGELAAGYVRRWKRIETRATGLGA